jgi:hypothetical protein
MTKASSTKKVPHLLPKKVPHLLPLKRVAREIGVSRDTIIRHPAEFFPVIKLGHKRFVASAAYEAWITERLPQTSGSPALDGVVS